MTQTRHFCDSCGHQILEGRSLFKVAAGPLRKRAEELDLCLECLPKIEAILTTTGLVELGASSVRPARTPSHVPAAAG